MTLQRKDYLELASRLGMEALRRECPNNRCVHGEENVDLSSTEYWLPCKLCQGRGWVPLPEAERMGALVRLSHGVWLRQDFQGWWFVAKLVEGQFGLQVTQPWPSYPKPEAALTEALLSATEVKSFS